MKEKIKNKKVTVVKPGVVLAIDLSKKKPGFCVGNEKGEILKCFSIPGEGKNKAKVILQAIAKVSPQYILRVLLYLYIKKAPDNKNKL